MKLLYISFAIICAYSTAKCQSIYDRYSVINIYYQSVFEPEKVITIEKCKDIFGNYTLEEEEEMCFRRCESNSSDNCTELVSNHLKDRNNSRSLLFSMISNLFTDNGYTYLDSSEIKQKSKVIDYGNPSFLIIKITYDSQITLYFKINKYTDETSYIQDIFVNNGESIFNGFNTRSSKSIDLKAVIKDQDGYTNVREDPNVKSKILGQIYNGEQFIFSPDHTKTWWKIKSLDKDLVGYIHKSRIKLLYN